MTYGQYLYLDLPFRVKGKSRPRFNSKTGVAYMPTDYTLNVADVQWKLRAAQASAAGFFSPTAQYAVWVVANRLRRRPTSKADQARLELECPLGASAGGKPDCDNLLGTLMDAANGILYRDDSQVVEAYTVRVWSDAVGVKTVIARVESKPPCQIGAPAA